MKQIKSLLVFGLLVISTLTTHANDYALLSTYPLLKDMNMVKKEQKILYNIEQLISRDTNQYEQLFQEEQKFNTLLTGLKNGDQRLGLKGTELDLIIHQINRVEQMWKREKRVLNAALKNSIYRHQAFRTIRKISTELNTLHKLYAQSYTRYKKNSVMKSLVNAYIRAQVEQKQRYAINTIKN